MFGRPALERWGDMAAAGAIDRPYIHSPDRLARTYAYQGLLVDARQRAGVGVIFLSRELGQSPEDDLLLQVQGMMAEYARAKIIERHRRGKRHAARAGLVNVLSGAPYGYRDIPKHEGHGQAHYDAVPDAARVVRQVLDWVGRARWTIGEVCRRLTRAGEVTRTGKPLWDRRVVWGLRKNPAYMGAAGPARRGKARVPAEGPFPTTPEIALALRDEARAWGVPHRGVVADADDGDHPNVLAGLEMRQARDVVGGRTDVRVRGQRKAMGPVPRAATLLQALPRWHWRTMRWRQGTQEGLRQKVVAVRGWRITSDGQRHVGWLRGERGTRGQPEDRTSAWHTLPATATVEELAGYAHRRYAVEPFPAEATGEVGWDQYQGRLWPGVHRRPSP